MDPLPPKLQTDKYKTDAFQANNLQIIKLYQYLVNTRLPPPLCNDNYLVVVVITCKQLSKANRLKTKMVLSHLLTLFLRVYGFPG